MSNAESISAKLRRWADESEVRGKSKFPSTYALRELGIRKDRGMYWIEERELFRHIADEIDREIDELRESFANQRYVNIEDAVRGVALGIDDHGGTKAAIDRYYLPRPLFEDGEPVYIGAEIDDRKRGKLEVSRICYTDGGFYFNNSRGSNGRKMKGITYKHGERVGRPKQPVLDADGVPIEEGDVVYPNYGTHANRKSTVLDVRGQDDVIVSIISGGFERFNGKYLTHREPDTQERIDGDAMKGEYEYWGCTGTECMRCPALIDGKKPRHWYGVDWCYEAITLDLLRRQRELDGRDA